MRLKAPKTEKLNSRYLEEVGVSLTKAEGTAISSISQMQSKRRWAVVTLLFFGVLISYIDRGNLSIAAVAMMGDLNLSPVLMGTLMSSFFWSYSLLQIPAGFLSDRFGYKWTYAGAFILWSLASISIGLAHSFGQILAFRFLLGIGESIAGPASLCFIKRQFRADRQGLPTSIYVSGMMIGPAVGALLGAFLLDRMGWRPMFVLTGLVSFLWLVPWLVIVPEESGASPQATISGVGLTGKTALPWKALWSSPLTWGITINAFFYSYFWYFCLTWLPSYLMMAHGFSFLKMGTYMALPLVGMAIVSTVCGHTADRLITHFQKPLLVRKAFIIAGMMLASTILLILVMKSVSLLFPILLVSLMGVGLAAGNYWSLTQLISPADWIGRVAGYQNMIAQFAGVCAPLLTGLLIGESKRFGLSIFVAGMSPVLAAIVIALFIREKEVDRISNEILKNPASSSV
jgi:MFS family permease